ncbi:hypothetical protein [Pseudodesulfovibrio methanolicus]|uniref:Nucleotidyl transferase AbiEii/AbiGii toxin family protein n=1 Tax=Pseudodesulfovibrio methanolicus TaxID=3126690 RepID=A0ABZ2IUI7_9BACT
MNRDKYQAVDRVVEVALLLGDLAGQCVFVGGAATGLLLTDPATPNVRPTLDVDVIVELTTTGELYRLQDALRARGFMEDMESKVICRWRHHPIILDVMPTKPEILGFANRWYPNAVRYAHERSIDGVRLRFVSPAYFLATKLEAFHGRGGGDYMASHDMEDFIAVLDGRLEIVDDVAGADIEVQYYLADQFDTLLSDDDFLDALPGHLPGDAASQARVPLIIERMKSISALKAVR